MDATSLFNAQQPARPPTPVHLHLHHQQQFMAQEYVPAVAAAAAASIAGEDDLDFLSEDAASVADGGASSPAPSSASSSVKEKWQKRHACDVPDCGKSFDSKWALIRFVSVHTREQHCGCAGCEGVLTLLLRCCLLPRNIFQAYPRSHGGEAVPMHIPRLRQVFRREVGHDAVRFVSILVKSPPPLSRESLAGPTSSKDRYFGGPAQGMGARNAKGLMRFMSMCWCHIDQSCLAIFKRTRATSRSSARTQAAPRASRARTTWNSTSRSTPKVTRTRASTQRAPRPFAVRKASRSTFDYGTIPAGRAPPCTSDHGRRWHTLSFQN